MQFREAAADAFTYRWASAIANIIAEAGGKDSVFASKVVPPEKKVGDKPPVAGLEEVGDGEREVRAMANPGWPDAFDGLEARRVDR